MSVWIENRAVWYDKHSLWVTIVCVPVWATDQHFTGGILFGNTTKTTLFLLKTCMFYFVWRLLERQFQWYWHNVSVMYRISQDRRQRTKREAEEKKPEESQETPRHGEYSTIINTIKRESRKFCDNGGGV